MLEKIVTVDFIEVLINGCVQVRTKTSILENGEEITGSFHRHVIRPGDDYSNEDPRVQAICAVMHTSEAVAAYRASQEDNKPTSGS